MMEPTRALALSNKNKLSKPKCFKKVMQQYIMYFKVLKYVIMSIQFIKCYFKFKLLIHLILMTLYFKVYFHWLNSFHINITFKVNF